MGDGPSPGGRVTLWAKKPPDFCCQLQANNSPYLAFFRHPVAPPGKRAVPEHYPFHTAIPASKTQQPPMKATTPTPKAHPRPRTCQKEHRHVHRSCDPRLQHRAPLHPRRASASPTPKSAATTNRRAAASAAALSVRYRQTLKAFWPWRLEVICRKTCVRLSLSPPRPESSRGVIGTSANVLSKPHWMSFWVSGELWKVMC